MTTPPVDAAPVGQNSSYVPDKTFIKVANQYFLTPVLNSPTLDQRAVISSLISNSSVMMRTILSKINIDDSFSSNFKSLNQHYVQDLGNCLKFLHSLEDTSPLPHHLKDLKKSGLSLTILKRISSLSRYQCAKCKITKIPCRTPNILAVKCACCNTEACET